MRSLGWRQRKQKIIYMYIIKFYSKKEYVISFFYNFLLNYEKKKRIFPFNIKNIYKK